MSQFIFRGAAAADFPVLADLRRAQAAADRFDASSTMERLPATEDFASMAESHPSFEVIEREGSIVGYTSVRWWDEDAGQRVVLADWYGVSTVEGIDRAALEHAEHVIDELEFDASTRRRAVIGVNASSVQTLRAAAIEAATYAFTFSQIEMELVDDPAVVRSLPDGVTRRTVRPDDAPLLIELMQRAWAGREFFTSPSVERIDAWLRRSDLSLFFLACAGRRPVGLVASEVRNGVGVLDDVQVDHEFQRRGIATALILENLRELRARGVATVRLNTEGHDPAGARSLYEGLGFRVVREYHRYRKPLDVR